MVIKSVLGGVVVGRLGLLVACLCASLAACGGDDDDDREATYAGVSRWECYADSSSGQCDCYGLGPNDSLDVGGSDITEVNACAGYAECKMFYDSDFEDWTCICGPAGFTPAGPFADSLSEVESVRACPPAD